ncbi:OTU protein [Elasticomyces elasticus]|nr:OTU protein [Elasticomyces elasticus]
MKEKSQPFAIGHESMEELQAKHRREARDLQSKITQKKKSATKKTRKGVNDECDILEQELRVRQEQELAALSGTSDIHEGSVSKTSLEDVMNRTQSLNVSQEQEQRTNGMHASEPSHADTAVQGDGVAIEPSQLQRPNRQKMRMARRAAEQEALFARAAQEASDLPNLKQQERSKMLDEFRKRGLQEKEIKADGHCLYSAFADQMEQLGISLTPVDKSLIMAAESKKKSQELPDYRRMRQAAASYIERNQNDFAPFLEEPLNEYVHKVRDTGEWGGQLELMALAKTYGVNINVLQGDGRVEEIEGSGKTGQEQRKAWLAYYRHGFGLGEHYNSLRKAP